MSYLIIYIDACVYLELKSHLSIDTLSLIFNKYFILAVKIFLLYSRSQVPHSETNSYLSHVNVSLLLVKESK